MPETSAVERKSCIRGDVDKCVWGACEAPQQENAGRSPVSACFAPNPSVLLSFDGRDVQNGQSLRDMVAAEPLRERNGILKWRWGRRTGLATRRVVVLVLPDLAAAV